MKKNALVAFETDYNSKQNTSEIEKAYSTTALGIPTINPPHGRVAIVANGNSPNPDDHGGTAVSIVLLRASGLENILVHYSHSCDLVRDNRISETAEKKRHALMQAACDVTARPRGGLTLGTVNDIKKILLYFIENSEDR